MKKYNHVVAPPISTMCRARISKPFKKFRNRFPAWRAGTTTIPGLLKRLKFGLWLRTGTAEKMGWKEKHQHKSSGLIKIADIFSSQCLSEKKCNCRVMTYRRMKSNVLGAKGFQAHVTWKQV